jgi:hypothetical protein
MPLLSKQMIRSAFLNLWFGFGLATLLMIWKAKPAWLPDSYPIGGWILAHVDLLLVGWMVQLAMGVSYWIFPRLPETRTERGRYGYAYGAALLLNLGVWSYTFALIQTWGWLQVLGLAAQAAAIGAYAYHIKPRVRPTIVPPQVTQ